MARQSNSGAPKRRGLREKTSQEMVVSIPPEEKSTVSEKTIEQYEDEIVRRITDLTYIISGLEHYGPFNKVIEMFKETRRTIDDNWHLVNDTVKLSELRMTKYAVNTLIDYIQNLKNDRTKLQEELEKIVQPEKMVNKDYDEQ